MTDYQISDIKTIAILGGTGKEGKGLGYRWAKMGYKIIVGSRQVEKALAAVEDLKGMFHGEKVDVCGMTNDAAAAAADMAVMTVPYAAHEALLEGVKAFVQGKIFVDVTVPLVPPKVSRVTIPPAGSASMRSQQILGEGVDVVSAFQNISYENLLHEGKHDCEVLVTGANKSAKAVVLELVKAAGMDGWDAGPLENSIVAEGLTSILIYLNKQYGTDSAGIQITGIQRPK